MITDLLHKIGAILNTENATQVPALRNEASRLADEIAACWEAMHQLEESLRPLDGPQVRDPGLAISWLDEADPNKRVAGLSSLVDRLGPAPWLLQKCEQLAFADPDQEVRDVALGCLGSLCHGTHDQKLGEKFAAIVGCESERPERRYLAYNNLFRLRGDSWDSWPVLTKPWVSFRFPDDVDWALVNSFLRTSDSAS